MTTFDKQTNQEIINGLEGMYVETGHDMLQVKLMIALIQSLDNIEKQLSHIADYMYSLESSLYKR